MISIIRALSQVRKGWWRLWFPHSRDETSDFIKNKRGQRSPPKRKKRRRKKRKKGKRKKEEKEKNERKREKGQCYYPFTTLVLQSSTMIFMIESLICCHFHILVGIFHYRTWLVYSRMGFLECPRSSWASKLDAHPLSFFCWAFIYL